MSPWQPIVNLIRDRKSVRPRIEIERTCPPQNHTPFRSQEGRDKRKDFFRIEGTGGDVPESALTVRVTRKLLDTP